MEFFQSSQFGAKAEKLMKKHRVPGLSVAVIHGNKTDQRAFGFASVKDGKKCTSDTLFDIASSSKVLTAASVALLVEDDKNHPNVAWDTPVSKLLPEDFVMSDPEYTKNVTVEDILGHRSGLATHDLSYFGVGSEHGDDALSITRNVRNLQIAAPLRSKHIYNNIMYTVATLLVEKETKTSFPDFLEDRFFQPLGMAASNLQPSRSIARGFGPRIAAGHTWDDKEDRYREYPALECPEGQGAGSIVTTAGDYLKLVKALLRQEAPITPAVYQGLTEIRSLPNPSSKNLMPLMSPKFYCLGLIIKYYRGHAVIGHNGGVPGFGSRFLWVPSLDLGAVFLGNSLSTAFLADGLERALIDSLMGPKEADGSDDDDDDDEQPAIFTEKRDFTTASLKEDDAEPQKMPLSAYTGQYWNPGYRGVTVQVREGRLFIDATDRGFPMELTFYHTSGQTRYVVRLRGGESIGGMVEDGLTSEAQFVFENDKAVRLGLRLEEGLKEPIWFDRVHGEATSYVLL